MDCGAASFLANFCRGHSRKASGMRILVRPEGELSEMRRMLMIAVVCVASLAAGAQEYPFPGAAATDDAALAQAMPQVAARVLASYNDPDRETYLDNLFRLQMVAGKYAEAGETIVEKRKLRAPKIPDGGDWVDVQYEMFARAKAREAADKVRFEQAYRQVFRGVVRRLDDVTSAMVIRTIAIPDVNDFAESLKADREKLKGKSSIAQADALNLVHDYQAWEDYGEFQTLAKPLIEEDDARRYVTQPPTPVKLANGATICALVTRPKTETKLPALMTFTIYREPRWDPVLARQGASHGYASIVAYTRGKACSPEEKIEPYRHDGEDSAALIEWIATQPWSDGRVGVYGGSYSGFTALATAKHMPQALKAIAVGAAAAPGLDVPMEGNIFWNFIYPWPFFTTDGKENDDATYNQNARWEKLYHDWYVSGRAYRDLDKIDAKPNPVFDEWIAHPSYDAYWQATIPYEKEFAKLDIPVLQTVGYYFGGPGADAYYFRENDKYAPKAEHYLVIGPYHHFGAQIGVVSLLGKLFPTIAGLQLDPVAMVDFEQLRYQFMDYVFKGKPRPVLLKDKVNYEVVGANVWKHAPSFGAMSDSKLRFYLTTTKADKAYRLSAQAPARGSFVTQTMNFADRSDADRKVPGGGVVDKEVDIWNALEFVSDPLPAATEMSGLFSGRLDFVANKRDFDFEMDLYELTPKGEYVQLAPYWCRASYLGHLSQRELLTPGNRTQLEFQAVRLMSRQLEAGSRVVLVLTIPKGPDRQINYGTGKDVSDETIHDAGQSLEIQWYGGSYVELPVAR